MPSGTNSNLPGNPKSTPPGGPPSNLPGNPPSNLPGSPPSDRPGSLPSTLPSGQNSNLPGNPQSTLPGGPPSNLPGNPQSNLPGSPPSALPGSLPSTLLVELDPGPGVGWQPFVLVVTDQAGTPVVQSRVEGRSRVEVPLAGRVGPQTLHFHCRESAGPVAGHDLRIIDFRVFRCDWAWAAQPPQPRDPAPAAPPAGVWRKVAGVLARAAGDGPVIQVWVPIPAAVRRFLRFCLPQRRLLPPMAAPETGDAPGLPPHGVPSASAALCLHTNACGDFTLLARERWHDLRAYPEWDLYSFHIDSVFCYAAHHGGARELLLPDPGPVPFTISSTDRGRAGHPRESRLFRRLRDRGVPWLEYEDLAGLVRVMRRLDSPLAFNHENWGVADLCLPETGWAEAAAMES